MKMFFKSGRYLLWIAAAAMIFGAGAVIGNLPKNTGSDDAGTGAALFMAGVLLWLRASKKEARFEGEQRRNQVAVPAPLETI